VSNRSVKYDFRPESILEPVIRDFEDAFPDEDIRTHTAELYDVFRAIEDKPCVADIVDTTRERYSARRSSENAADLLEKNISRMDCAELSDTTSVGFYDDGEWNSLHHCFFVVEDRTAPVFHTDTGETIDANYVLSVGVYGGLGDVDYVRVEATYQHPEEVMGDENPFQLFRDKVWGEP
jgi:hypothetical protein